MDVRLPDGTVVRGVPDGTTRAQLMQKLAGNGFDMAKLGIAPADQIPTDGYTAPKAAPQPGQPDPGKESLTKGMLGVVEAPLSMLTAIPASLAGTAYGVGKSVVDGKFGTPQGVKQAQADSNALTEAMTYRPRTETGNKLLQLISQAVNDSGIAGIPMAEIPALSASAVPARNALLDAAMGGKAVAAEGLSSGKNALAQVLKKQNPQMAGVGAASTEEAMLRAQRAKGLDVPIDLTRGQATRDFGELQFERETAKRKEGAPLRERYADQNDKIFQNFETWIDQTGAEQPNNLRAVGQKVVDALSAKRSEIKGRINAAYNAAREAGEMAEPVDVSALSAYLDQNRPAAVNAPVLTTVAQTIRKLDPNGTGKIALNDIEELRKLTRKLSTPETPNAAFGGDVIGLIDSATEGKGGPMYQQARRMYENYANEFKNRQVVSKLFSSKPGTKDRSVAMEDVVDHTLFKGSLDDVRHVRRVLQAGGGEAGEQAWKELQAATLERIKNEAFGNSARDQAGHPVGSAAALDKRIKELDADGKLEFIFGKQGAAKIRDVNDLAKDVYTTPPGSVNSSNTASILAGILDGTLTTMTGIPLPVASLATYGVKKVKSNNLSKQVNESLHGLNGSTHLLEQQR